MVVLVRVRDAELQHVPVELVHDAQRPQRIGERLCADHSCSYAPIAAKDSNGCEPRRLGNS